MFAQSKCPKFVPPKFSQCIANLKKERKPHLTITKLFEQIFI